LTDSKKKIPELIQDDRPSRLLPLADISKLIKEPQKDSGIISILQSSPDSMPLQINIPAKASVPNIEMSKSLGKLSGYNSIRSIRKGNNVNTKEKVTQDTNTETNTLLDQKFDKDDILRTWLEFSKQITEDIHLANAMSSCKPELIDDDSFEVLVSNQVLQKKMEEIRGRVESYMRNSLSNSHIVMTIKLIESVENLRPYTARERMDAMVKKNPNLLLLYRTFGLDLS
jgi:DNA polymerase-3 subunit gamma/tau